MIDWGLLREVALCLLAVVLWGSVVTALATLAASVWLPLGLVVALVCILVTLYAIGDEVST